MERERETGEHIDEQVLLSWLEAAWPLHGTEAIWAVLERIRFEQEECNA